MNDFEFNLTAKYNSTNALTLAKLARLSYRTEEDIAQQVTNWGFDRFTFISTPTPLESYDTQAFAIANSDLIVVVFRGTKSRTDWMNNLDFALIPGSAAGWINESQGRVHRGFFTALNSVWGQVTRAIEQFQTQGQPLWFTGHSLGGALATLAVAKSILVEPRPVAGLYTFGSPRVGDRVFAQNFNSQFKGQSFRLVNNTDIVTLVPPVKWETAMLAPICISTMQLDLPTISIGGLSY